ncbi:MAG: Bug family tripartite tricarboxylate transporter substrate binding protein [Beijerinckiaceae bacterium]
MYKINKNTVYKVKGARPLRFRLLAAGATAALSAVALAGPASAQQASPGVEAFYKGKQLNFIVGLAAGGGYDQYARTIARHLDRHLPGKPTIVVQNMTGAAGLNATNWLYTVAPRDGSTIGMTQRSVIVEPLYGTKSAVFDPVKFSWIASVNDEAYIAVTWKDRGINSIQDAIDKEFPVAADGPASDDYTWPAVMNRVLGTKFKIISGYKGKAEQRLATRRGETVGLIGWSWGALQVQEWDDYKAGNWKIIAHLGHGKHPDFDAPSVFDYAKTQEARDVLDFLVGTLIVGRPVFGPPGVPADRLDALRAAFMQTLKDPAFLAEAEKQKLEISPTDGAELAERVKRLYSTPPEVVARTQAARTGK